LIRFLFLLLFSVPAILSAQEKLKDLIPDLIDHDNMGNYYLVYGDELIQYTGQSAELNRFSNKTSGTISGLDASNALKILLHYADLGAIQFLDNRLGERSDFMDFQDLDYNQSELSCTSYNNGLWVYDRISLSIRRLDQSFKLDVQSGNLNQITGRILNPVKVLESNGRVYILDKGVGVVQCDIYGAYIKTIYMKGAEQMDIDGDKMYLLASGSILYYEPSTFDFVEVYSSEGIIDFSIKSKQLIFSNKEGLWLKLL